MPKYFSLLLVATLLLTLGCRAKTNVLAKVQGKDVTQTELDGYLRVKRIPATDAKRRDAAFDDLLQREAMATLIEKEPGLDRAAIDAELADVRRELLISRYMDHFLEQKVTDAAVKAYYDAHVKDYEQRKVHAAHILVRTNPKMSDAEKAAKLSTATDLKAKLDAGANFEELARSASDDKISGSRGGDLGWLREGSIDPEFSKRAFSAAPGVVSEPFVTPFGYHLMRVLEAPTVVRRPYQAVLGEINYQLRAEAKDAELKRLKASIKIEKQGTYKLDPKAQALDSARLLSPPRHPASADPDFAMHPPSLSPAPGSLDQRPATPDAAEPPAKAPLTKTSEPGPNTGASARPSATPARARPTPPPAPAHPAAPAAPPAAAPAPAAAQPE